MFELFRLYLSMVRFFTLYSKAELPLWNQKVCVCVCVCVSACMCMCVCACVVYVCVYVCCVHVCVVHMHCVCVVCMCVYVCVWVWVCVVSVCITRQLIVVIQWCNHKPNTWHVHVCVCEVYVCVCACMYVCVVCECLLLGIWLWSYNDATINLTHDAWSLDPEHPSPCLASSPDFNDCSSHTALSSLFLHFWNTLNLLDKII